MNKWLLIYLSLLMAGCTAMRDSSVASKNRPAPMPLIIDFQTGFIGNWIQLKVGEEHVRDAHVLLTRKSQILLDIALRIDDGGDAGVRVAHHIGGMSQTPQVELLKNHRRNIQAINALPQPQSVSAAFFSRPDALSPGASVWGFLQ